MRQRRVLARLRAQQHVCPVCGRPMDYYCKDGGGMMYWQCPEECAGLAIKSPATDDTIKGALKRKEW
ncbi:MAG: hypothetical protein KGL39_20845 [Patescibacteria group bacterium]|nr:hypothetical protein [Patescibacteria group bacterium]